MKTKSLIRLLSTVSLFTTLHASGLSEFASDSPESERATSKAMTENTTATRPSNYTDAPYRLTLDVLRELDAQQHQHLSTANDDVATQAANLRSARRHQNIDNDELLTQAGDVPDYPEWLGDLESLRYRAEAANMTLDELVAAIKMVRETRSGNLPDSLRSVLTSSNKPAFDFSTPLLIPTQLEALFQWIAAQWSDELQYNLNLFLRTVVTPEDPDYPATPLARDLFGAMEDNFSLKDFTQRLSQLFYQYVLPSLQGRLTYTFQINRPYDWATVQFLSLFFNEARSLWTFGVNLSGVGEDDGCANIDRVTHIIDGLQGTQRVQLLGIDAFESIEQGMILKHLAETRPKNTNIIVTPGSIDTLTTWLTSLSSPELQHYNGQGGRIDIVTVVNFKHDTFTDGTFAEALAPLSTATVAGVWEHTLTLKSFECMARGDIASTLHAVIQSPFGEQLGLGTLTANRHARVQRDSLATFGIPYAVLQTHPEDNTVGIAFSDPTSLQVITEIVSAHGKPHSKLKVLDLEGSQLSERAFDELAKLSPIHKIRFTGISIPELKAGKLAALKLKGANMVGCGMSADATLVMISGWLGNPEFMGVDLRGNEFNPALLALAEASGFNVYGTPQGIMIARK